MNDHLKDTLWQTFVCVLVGVLWGLILWAWMVL